MFYFASLSLLSVTTVSSTYTQPFGSIHTCELPRTGGACVCSPLGAASVWKCSHCDSFPRKMVKRPQSWRWVHLRGRCRLQHRFVEVLHLVSANNGKYVRGILHYVRDRNTDSQESRNGCQRAVFYTSPIRHKDMPFAVFGVCYVSWEEAEHLYVPQNCI